MARPTRRSLAVGAIGGLGTVAVVLALYVRGDYPAVDSAVRLATVAVGLFVFGFASLLVTAHTRLLAPAGGFVALLGGVAAAEVVSPAPEWYDRAGFTIVEGPTYVASYAGRWYLWLSLLFVAGGAEFAIRRGYGIGDDRLRDLPPLPLSRQDTLAAVAAVAGLFGLASAVHVLEQGVSPSSFALVVFATAGAVAAVPLAGLLSRGVVTPTLLFALAVPYPLFVDVFRTVDSPVHFLLFGAYAVVMALAWLLEDRLRTRLWGWAGGRFAGEPNADAGRG